MNALFWIVLGVLMSALSLSGALALALPRPALERLLPVVAFAAGALIGGALFFLLPEANEGASPHLPLLSVAAGFARISGSRGRLTSEPPEGTSTLGEDRLPRP